jgi:outer membrane murein-binding lipoprotein Lpp
MPAPLTPNAPGGSAIGDLLAGGAPGQGADEIRAKLEQLAGQVSDLGTQVDAIAQDLPMVGPEVSQIKTLLKQIVIKAARSAPVATASGAAVPTANSQGPMPGR